MTLEEIQKQCIEDTKEWFPELYYDMGFLTLALAGEVGELANLVKKIIRGTHDAMALKTLVEEEAIDSFIYLMNIFAVLGTNVEEAYRVKRAHNVERFGRTTAEG